MKKKGRGEKKERKREGEGKEKRERKKRKCYKEHPNGIGHDLNMTHGIRLH